MQFTLAELWDKMGLFARLVVVVLGAMSLSSLVVMAERILAFARSRAESTRFLATVAAVLANGDFAAANARAKGGGGGHLGRLVGAGLGAFEATGSVPREVRIESVARALERQGQREVQSFKRGLGVLATVGSTAPFVGLLGTVMGIINAFQMMAAAGSGGLGTVSAGIAEALVTTAFGLLVAIPAVMAFNFLQGWVDARMVDISETSNELLDAVARRI